ncbi:SPFH domain-containing protein [Massilia sp. CF038]|uniref:SPFH domain-containing protein n=1 Tax=Massilia sp. CF038 TaxID=1881045 RepID=UPI00091E4C23|nr:SPFH domain-containing protein [Massilia sp. CF038]SHH17935.1 Membrane protease subunit, stomatin/prohibitin family, contains C-terminal Zn-ribbon domain [Massilia sp. CF038]
MSLGSFIKKQFIDVLQWNEETEGVLAWRFPMQDFEIQNGAILNVRESQVAVFVNEGVIADVFGPGTHKLTTQTLPILTNLKNWDKFFDSPFKSDVYYFSTRVQTGRKWGTPQPITIRDKDFDMIRVRAFGMFSYRVADARKFFTEISGTREVYTRDEVEEQLRGLLMATMASSLGGANVAFLDMAANQALMAQSVKGDLAAAFARYGIGLDEFNVASVSLPEELQAALDERISAGMKGGLSADKMAGFTKFNVASSIPLAAQNEGGLAGIGAGLGAGAMLGQAMAQGMASATAQPAAPAAAAEVPIEERLAKLKGLLDKGLISAADYDSTKAELLKKLIG